MTKEQAMQILGITDYSFTPEILKNAHRKAAKRCHPDLGGTDEDMRLVNQAYEFLSNPDNNRRMTVTHSSILNIVCC